MKIFDQSIKKFIKLNKSLTNKSNDLHTAHRAKIRIQYFFTNLNEDGRYYPFCAEKLCITPTMQLAWYSINVEGMGLKRMSQKGARLLICVGNEYLCIHQCPLSTSHQLCLLEDCSLVQLCGHS